MTAEERAIIFLRGILFGTERKYVIAKLVTMINEIEQATEQHTREGISAAILEAREKARDDAGGYTPVTMAYAHAAEIAMTTKL